MTEPVNLFQLAEAEKTAQLKQQKNQMIERHTNKILEMISSSKVPRDIGETPKDRTRILSIYLQTEDGLEFIQDFLLLNETFRQMEEADPGFIKSMIAEIDQMPELYQMIHTILLMAMKHAEAEQENNL
jgi:hypothetical protein